MIGSSHRVEYKAKNYAGKLDHILQIVKPVNNSDKGLQVSNSKQGTKRSSTDFNERQFNKCV